MKIIKLTTLNVIMRICLIHEKCCEITNFNNRLCEKAYTVLMYNTNKPCI